MTNILPPLFLAHC